MKRMTWGKIRAATELISRASVATVSRGSSGRARASKRLSSSLGLVSRSVIWLGILPELA